MNPIAVFCMSDVYLRLRLGRPKGNHPIANMGAACGYGSPHFPFQNRR